MIGRQLLTAASMLYPDDEGASYKQVLVKQRRPEDLDIITTFTRLEQENDASGLDAQFRKRISLEPHTAFPYAALLCLRFGRPCRK